jgi:hypothetical protein
MRRLIDAYLTGLITKQLLEPLEEIERVAQAASAATEEQSAALAGVRSSIDALVESINAHNLALDATTSALRSLLIRVRAVEALMKNEKELPR